MPTLYRHYRPQTFAELVGQPHVTHTLEQAIVRERLAHAYLFYGPRGTGKTTTARILAKRVNCQNPRNAEPCLTCASCTAFSEHRHLDIIEIDAASNRSIDDIRALRDSVATAPTLGTYKVYIIDEVHMLTHEAAAALLKTLEEPVKHVLFILATTELHKVLPTILSRCQLFRFRRATDDELRARLTHLLTQEKRVAEPGALDFIIARSDGCFRDAESLLGQILTLHAKKIIKNELVEFMGLPPERIMEQFLTAMVRGESAPALAAVDESFASGFDPEQFLKESIRAARDGALSQAKGDTRIPAFAQAPHSAERLPVIIRALLQALQDLAYVPQPMIAVHLAIITTCTQKGSSDSARQHAQQEETPATNSEPASVAAHRPDAAPLSLERVAASWADLIQRIKEKNPVAATFLRAIEPTRIEDTTVVLVAHYALHRNFFKKPEHKQLIEQHLSDLLAVPITIRCELNAPNQPQPGGASSAPQEEDLYQAVQEVFGQPREKTPVKK